MLYIEAPQTWPMTTSKGLFLAGGITGCPDWQAVMCELLGSTSLTLLNPRRAKFSMHDPAAAQGQIEWEYMHLRAADAILFWFPCDTLCPIVLYELGTWSYTAKKIFIGVHEKYQRRADVVIQTQLVRPGFQIANSLEALAEQVKNHFEGK